MELPSIFLNRVLAEVAKRNASSFHLVVGSLPQMRIDGELVVIEGENVVTNDLLDKIVNSFLSKEEIEQLKKDRDITLIKVFGGNFRFRTNIFYQKEMLSISFYYIQGVIQNLGDLNLPQKVKNFIRSDFGLLIIGGPFGSGRTTTAAAFIEEINKKSNKHIVTFEDPIEYLFVSKKSIIEQRQIGVDVKSIAEGLDYCLQEDVDVVYIGEMKREFESAVFSILELAAGNCLVILELEVDKSIKAIQKIISIASQTLSPEASCYNLADVLLGIIVQRLIPRIGGGMMMAVEVLIANAAIKSLIRQNKIYQIESIMQTSREEGMISLDKALDNLVKSGKIKPDSIPNNIMFNIG